MGQTGNRLEQRRAQQAWPKPVAIRPTPFVATSTATVTTDMREAA
jgi:hypothetical protein